SSRRRHTRSKRDWSSDVCSSDLDVKSCLSCTGNRFLDDRSCQSVDLDIHLDCCDTFMCTCHLEIHVSEEVFQTLDICQYDVIVVCLSCYKSAGDTCYCALDRHTGCHQGHAGCADTCLRCGSVGLECLGYRTDCVREFFLRRKYRYEGTLSQCSMS